METTMIRYHKPTSYLAAVEWREEIRREMTHQMDGPYNEAEMEHMRQALAEATAHAKTFKR